MPKKIDQKNSTTFGFKEKKRRVEVGLFQTNLASLTGLIDALTFYSKFAISIRNLE
jgi:hypothetical protein